MLDIRTLKPLDEEALLASAAKTGRVVIVQEAPRTAGYGAELAAILAEKAMLDLRGPVIRVTGYDVPYPYWQIEDAYMPSVERVRRRGAEAARLLSGTAPPLARARRVAATTFATRPTGEPVRWEDPRVRVVPVAGVCFRRRGVARRVVRARAVGSRWCPSPRTSTIPNAVAIWNEERTLQARLRAA